MSQLSPTQELEMFEAMFTRRKEVGSTWYVISMKWWKSWKAYTGFTENSEKIKRTVRLPCFLDIISYPFPFRTRKQPSRPGKINNKPLEGDKKGTMSMSMLDGEDFVCFVVCDL